MIIILDKLIKSNKENYNVNLVIIVLYLIIKINWIFEKDIKTNDNKLNI